MNHLLKHCLRFPYTKFESLISRRITCCLSRRYCHIGDCQEQKDFIPCRGIQHKGAMDLPEGVIIGFGNPLLDITTSVEENVLEKYELRTNEAIIADEKHLPLFEELTNQENVVFTAGGACQNSMRVFQWLVGKPSRAIFVGAVGKDKFGETIAKRAQAEGVLTMYQIIDDEPTGTCAVIVTGQQRSLVANLGAAACFTEDWLDDEGNMCLVEQARFYYATGFFVAVNSQTVLRIAKLSSENYRTFLLNFSAVFVLQTHKEKLDEIIFYADMVIGNKQEALAYANFHDWNTRDIFVIGKKLQSLPKDNNRPRIIMITDAVCPVLCFLENDRVIQYPVPKIDKNAIVDTNGCGDAFVGGFLSQFVQNMPLDYCIRTGIFASQQMTRVVGVQVGNLPNIKASCI